MVQVNVGRRNRAYAELQLIKAFMLWKHRSASPYGDTPFCEPTLDTPGDRA